MSDGGPVSDDGSSAGGPEAHGSGEGGRPPAPTGKDSGGRARPDMAPGARSSATAHKDAGTGPDAGSSGTRDAGLDQAAETGRGAATGRDLRTDTGLPRREVDPKLLELLACPLTRTRLSWDPARGELVSRAAKLAYPVRDGVPIMLPSEARSLEPEELDR